MTVFVTDVITATLVVLVPLCLPFGRNFRIPPPLPAAITHPVVRVSTLQQHDKHGTRLQHRDEVSGRAAVRLLPIAGRTSRSPRR